MWSKKLLECFSDNTWNAVMRALAYMKFDFRA